MAHRAMIEGMTTTPVFNPAEHAEEIEAAAERIRAEVAQSCPVLHYTDPHPGRVGSERIVSPCGKCNNTGVLPEFYFKEGGRCFDCGGTGEHSVLVSSVRARVRRRVKDDNDTREKILASATKRAEDEVRERVQAENARAAEQEAAEAAATMSAELEHLFGTKVSCAARLVRASTYESVNRYTGAEQVGVRLVFESDQFPGATMVSFGTSAAAWGLYRQFSEQGASDGDLTCTVKKIESFRGQVNVIVTRVKFVQP